MGKQSTIRCLFCDCELQLELSNASLKDRLCPACQEQTLEGEPAGAEPLQ